jgi:hypothetical protein
VTTIDDGSKEPRRTSGAPFPPATEHTDGPDDRPRRDVPSADEATDDAGEGEEEGSR